MAAERDTIGPPEPETMLLVLFGASNYPHKPEWSNPVLGTSAQALRDYMLSPAGLALAPGQLLDLFDDNAAPADQLLRIADFLKAAQNARDLVLYYIGHGGFHGDDYHLGVRCTQHNREFLTTIESKKLAKLIRDEFRRKRVYVILDSCFSASAASDWQGGEIAVAVRKMAQPLPAHGTAFLAAASKYDVTRAPRTERCTVFTGAVLTVLTQGVDRAQPRLSIYELYEEVRDVLRRRETDGDDREGMPELHVPSQRDGDVSLLPVFPNAAYSQDEASNPAVASVAPRASEPKRISLSELDAVLDQARDEGWRELAIIGPVGVEFPRPRILEAHTYYLREPLGTRVAKLAQLAQLTSLALNGNQLGDEGVRALAKLTQLTYLALSYNELGIAGAHALAQFIQLAYLDLSYNQLGDEGARALAKLTQLTYLDLSYNQLGDEGARALAPLTHLTFLNLSRNRLGDEGARALVNLTQLTYLILSFNDLGDEGARALAELNHLTLLALKSNQLGNEGARALTKLSQLTYLDLSSNRLRHGGVRALLDAWCDFPRSATLRRLELGNQDQDTNSMLPEEVLESGNAQSILAAYRRFRDAEHRGALRPLNEAKLVVVGNEAVGKTSLIRYLVLGQPRDPDERKTPGTAIHEKIEVSTWSVHQSPVRVNVWDFGGQEIMRGTHRFFLTERSLYLLVLEDRREDDRSIYEWLEIITQRGGDSPVIIAVNKTDSDVSQRQIDETALRRTYPTIVGFVRTSCNAGEAAARSIGALRMQIATTLSESALLKHVRDPIPQSWLRVKDTITKAAGSHSVLPVRDFERLCESDATPAAERITAPHEQQALLALLHDLGVVVAHGLRQDAPAVRKEITILDPNWLTGAIYALINSPTVLNQRGELRHDQLGELLAPARYPAQRHELILNMMQEPALRLCFPIAHSSPPRYLLPDALPVNEPDYGVWPAEALRFRYKYKQLPTEFVPRFIAAAHSNLTDKPTLWRTGVVLGAEGCRILVRGDTANDCVEIHVAGTTGQRAALSIVRHYFDAVHRYYAKLSVEARVPLPEQPEVDVGYEHLVQLEREEGLDYTWRPERAHRKYSVRELLEGVRNDEARRRLADESAYRKLFEGVRNDETRRRLADEDVHGDGTGRRRPRAGIDNLAPRDLGGATTPRPTRPAISPYRGKVDFGILTIREDENDAVLRRFVSVTTDKRQRQYRIRKLALPSGGSYTLAVVRCLEQGNTDAQAATHALLEDLAPRFVLVVGIAGGLPSDEFTLGDVVVSSRIVDFSVEAVIRAKKREYALGGGPLHPDAAKLAADIRAMITDGELGDWNSKTAIKQRRPQVNLGADRFSGDGDWKKSVREKLRKHFTGKTRRPLATTAAIASSDRLMKDGETMSVWLKIARQVVAIEMESAGIYKATQGRGVPFLAIRGISDVVGFKRGPAWTAYACETAAAFARAFLLTRPIEPLAQP